MEELHDVGRMLLRLAWKPAAWLMVLILGIVFTVSLTGPIGSAAQDIWVQLSQAPIGLVGLSALVVVAGYVVLVFSLALRSYRRDLKRPLEELRTNKDREIETLRRERDHLKEDAGRRLKEYHSWIEQIVGTKESLRIGVLVDRPAVRAWFDKGARHAHEALSALCEEARKAAGGRPHVDPEVRDALLTAEDMMQYTTAAMRGVVNAEYETVTFTLVLGWLNKYRQMRHRLRELHAAHREIRSTRALLDNWESAHKQLCKVTGELLQQPPLRAQAVEVLDLLARVT